MPLNFGGQKRSGVFDTVWPSATMPTRQWCRIAPRKARADRTRHRLVMPQQPNLYLEPKWLRCLATARKTIADSTRRSSQAVPHPSTNRALRCLTSEVRRDPVYSTRYGRQRKVSVYCTVRCGVHSDINLSSVLNHGGVHRRCWLLPWTDKHKLLCSLALGNNPWKYCQLVFQSSVT